MRYSLDPKLNDNLIVKLTFNFSLDIMRLCRKLKSNYEYEFSNQIIKSGTSIGANVREAQNAESLKYFISKLKISAKEANETEYWLLLLAAESKTYYVESLITQLVHIQKVLNKIISTSKAKLSH